MMKDNIAVIDIETPNAQNDSICSIGIVFIENGIISDKLYYLVNPEDTFDYRNIQIHGITEEDVINAPTFPEIWNKLSDIFSGHLLCGHNFGFDLSCIKKALFKHSLNAVPAYYVDTLSISRNLVKDIDNHRLDTLCEHFDICLDRHHDALCDSLATAALLLKLENSYSIDLDCFIKKYSFDDQPTKRDNNSNRNYTSNTIAIKELQGILIGIICDNYLSDSEIVFLREWLSEHTELSGNYPFDKIYSAVEKVLEDGIVTEEERDSLSSLINKILNPVDSSVDDCMPVLNGAAVCLTGEFDCMTRSELADLLTAKGAVIKKSVTKTLDYLFVGDNGSEAWAHGNYGTKVKKAMELNDKGCTIKILKEKDIVECLIDE